MTVREELDSLEAFNAWQGGKDTQMKICKAGKGEEFVIALEELYPSGMGKTELNDLLWFERDFCLSLVGLSD